MIPGAFEAFADASTVASDLTAGAGLPMFPAAESRQDCI
jgi:hypothetical protein